MNHEVLPPLSLYVHFPWCVRKCPYCDFNSHAVGGELPEQAYLTALIADLDAEREHVAGRPLGSIFLGGGTPSLFAPATIGALLDAVAARMPLSADVEVTLEANPGTIDAARFAGYYHAGVNRISIGVQSFDDGALRRLGRIHDAGAARQAVRSAQTAGFTRINTDLMHGLPEQSGADAARDIATAIDLGVDHISWYQLTIEPNTEFYSAPPRLPDEAELEDIESSGMTLLQAAGFTRYEVSAWAKHGQQCRHNQNYWTFGDYVGIGAGAHSKVTQTEAQTFLVQRFQKTRLPAHYLADQQRRNVIALTDDDLAGEFLMNALRLRDGVNEAVFRERTGLPPQRIAEGVARLRAEGLLQPARLATTALGYRFLDEVVARLAG